MRQGDRAEGGALPRVWALLPSPSGSGSVEKRSEPRPVCAFLRYQDHVEDDLCHGCPGLWEVLVKTLKAFHQGEAKEELVWEGAPRAKLPRPPDSQGGGGPGTWPALL